ncbi:unnamed protein product [Ectocarpus fasciculatus]
MTTKMKQSFHPTMATLRAWSSASARMKRTHNVEGRTGATRTINEQVPGTSASTASKWEAWLAQLSNVPDEKLLYEQERN